MRPISRGATAAVAAAGGYATLYRLGQTWGATDQERKQALVGDELLPNARAWTTHAITIEAPAPTVWPWLVQMGWGRAGWYTYRWVDRLLFPANALAPARAVDGVDLELASSRADLGADPGRPAQPDAPGPMVVREAVSGHDRPSGLRHGAESPARPQGPGRGLYFVGGQEPEDLADRGFVAQRGDVGVALARGTAATGPWGCGRRSPGTAR